MHYNSTHAAVPPSDLGCQFSVAPPHHAIEDKGNGASDDVGRRPPTTINRAGDRTRARGRLETERQRAIDDQVGYTK